MQSLSGLIAIGFTEYEAKVYTALLAEHPATGYQISKQSGVPRSMVYEALGRLHARGAVLRTDDRRATLYSPVPPDTLLDRYEESQARLVQTLRHDLSALYASEPEERVWTIAGRAAALAYAGQMVQAARAELWLVLADADLPALRDDVVAASERGVAVRALLTGTGDLRCGHVAHHPPLESELQEVTTLLLVVADGRTCLIAHSGEEMTATITGNRHLVFIARQFVWMEIFTQRLTERLGPDLLALLDAETRQVLSRFSTFPEAHAERTSATP